MCPRKYLMFYFSICASVVRLGAEIQSQIHANLMHAVLTAGNYSRQTLVMLLQGNDDL